MQPFVTLDAVAAALPIANIDTDKLVPGRFLKGVTRAGLGRILLHPLRFDADDRPRSDFVLNQSPWDRAGVLIALDNFGCGSSREHAPWALTQYGFRAIIAPSYADIFFNNSFKNGLLPIVLSELDVARLFDEVKAFPGYKLRIDLDRQVVVAADGRELAFDIEPFRKYCLLNGFDDIGLTLRHSDKIRAFEAERLARHPWLESRPVV